MKGAVQRVLQTLREDATLIAEIWRGRFPPYGEHGATWLERSALTVLLVIRILSLSRISQLPREPWWQSQVSETYVVGWLIGLSAFLWTVPHAFAVSLAIVGYRLIDSLAYRLSIILIDRHDPNFRLQSLNRSLLILMMNYAEIVVGFAALYAVSASVAPPSAPGAARVPTTHPLDALYFSAVTAFTLGYGDVTPINGLGEAFVISEVAVSFILVVLVLSSFLTGINLTAPSGTGPDTSRPT